MSQRAAVADYMEREGRFWEEEHVIKLGIDKITMRKVSTHLHISHVRGGTGWGRGEWVWE